MRTYGVDYFENRSEPFKNVTDLAQEINGEKFSLTKSPFYNYRDESIIAVPSPSTEDTPLAVHAIGIDRELAYAIYGYYVRILQDRTNLNELETLEKYDDIKHEDAEDINHAIVVSRALLESESYFFHMSGGISAIGIRSIQVSFGLSLQKIIKNDLSDHLSGDYQVYMSKLDSFIDSFDNFDEEFSSLNMAPSATPRIIPVDVPMGKGGERLNFSSEYALIIPTTIGDLSN